LLVNASEPAKVANVPDVGRVTLVAAVVVRFREKAPVVEKASAKVTFLPEANDNVSLANATELVFNAISSFTVKVLPAPRVKVPVPDVMVLPLIVLLVNASAPAKVANVPDVGRVTLVAAVAVRFMEKAPVVEKASAKEAVLPAASVKVPVPDVMVLPLIVLLVNASAPAKVANVPDVGRVTLVAPVVVRVRGLVAVNVSTSPPPNVMALVPSVVLSFTVRVLPAPSVKVPVPDVIVLPLRDVTVVAPAPTTPSVERPVTFSEPPNMVAPVPTVRVEVPLILTV
jgi:hypothetical protein